MNTAKANPIFSMPLVTLFIAALVVGHNAFALVNPLLQPADLFDRYECVLVATVSAVEQDLFLTTLDVRNVCKGTFTAKTIRMQANEANARGAFQNLVHMHTTIVAYVGMKGRNRERNILFYAGGGGRWQTGVIVEAGDAENDAVWEWTAELDKELYGTFNGHPEQLGRMMQDHVNGNAFFPAVPFEAFRDDLVVDRLDGPVRGVALYDINSDGTNDLFATSLSGNRLYRQVAPLVFSNVTESVGLAGTAGVSCSFADVDGNGRPDLLIDASIYLQDENWRFTLSDRLKSPGTVKMSAFADLTGNGYPDVLLSMEDGGLRLYRNPASKGEPFTDITGLSGLDLPACGAGKVGFFFLGDWNADGRTDIFYSVSPGLLLLQDAEGRFAPLKDVPPSDFKVWDGEEYGTGAGTVGTVWSGVRPDVLFATDKGVNIFAFEVGKRPFDAGQFGNELVVATESCLGLLAEDLNASGYIDIYAVSRAEDESNLLYVNRGYGSFYVSERYATVVFPGEAHKRGALGAAVGDVNGDGVNDILLGGIDGRLTLMINNTLSLRGVKEHPTRQERFLQGTGILTVRVAGRRGVPGAVVTLQETGETIAYRVIGSNSFTGCRGPDEVNIAVRNPGRYEIVVRYTDGLVVSRPAEVTAGKRSVMTIKRGNDD